MTSNEALQKGFVHLYYRVGKRENNVIMQRRLADFFRLFSVFFKQTLQIFSTNICEKMSIQYTVPGFEPTTFGT